MTRWATALALLIVFAATPALAVACAVQCETSAMPNRAGKTGHAHHHAGTQSSVFGLQSSVLVTDPDNQCRSHFRIELAAPERTASGAAEPAAAVFRQLEPLALLTRIGARAEVRPPPLESRTAAPLRI